MCVCVTEKPYDYHNDVKRNSVWNKKYQAKRSLREAYEQEMSRYNKNQKHMSAFIELIKKKVKKS